MSHFVKFIICMIVGLSNVSAAAEFPCLKEHPGVTRINCVIEKDGKVECHKGCTHPCIAFFDVTAPSNSNLNALLLEHLTGKKIVDVATTAISLELYGISVGKSIHDEWRKVTEKDINEFWEHITGLSAELKESRNLDGVHIGALNFGRYIFKVIHNRPK